MSLIKDKLIRHKSVESFERVLETKLDGALNLLRLVRVGMAVSSNSAAALFLRSQDASATWASRITPRPMSILNKLAALAGSSLAGSCRVAHLGTLVEAWAWCRQLESHLNSNGLGMISPESGGSLLINELRHGRKGDVEVIYSGELGTLELPIPAEAVPEPAEAFS